MPCEYTWHCQLLTAAKRMQHAGRARLLPSRGVVWLGRNLALPVDALEAQSSIGNRMPHQPSGSEPNMGFLQKLFGDPKRDRFVKQMIETLRQAGEARP